MVNRSIRGKNGHVYGFLLQLLIDGAFPPLSRREYFYAENV